MILTKLGRISAELLAKKTLIGLTPSWMHLQLAQVPLRLERAGSSSIPHRRGSSSFCSLNVVRRRRVSWLEQASRLELLKLLRTLQLQISPSTSFPLSSRIIFSWRHPVSRKQRTEREP